MRDFIIIGVVALIAITIGTAVFYFGPPSFHGDVHSAFAGSDSTTTIPFTVLEQGTNAVAVGDRVNYSITSEEDLASLWGSVFGAKNVSAVPQIDFSKYEVLAVFDGTHQTGGYSVQVSSVTDANGLRDVIITHTAPGSGCSNSKTQTSPFVLVQVPKTSFSLTHEDKQTTKSCK